MHPSDGLAFIRQHAPVALPGQTEGGEAVARSRGYLCPFGCGQRECDELGHCHHLEGYTDGHQEKDEKTGEMVTVYERTRKIADPRTGEVRWQTGERIDEKRPEGGIDEYAINRILKPNDVVVHLHNGKTGKAFAGTQWSRVYRPRKPGETPVFRPGTSQTPDLGQLQKVLTAQEEHGKRQDTLIRAMAKKLGELGVATDDLDLDLE